MVGLGGLLQRAIVCVTVCWQNGGFGLGQDLAPVSFSCILPEVVRDLFVSCCHYSTRQVCG